VLVAISELLRVCVKQARASNRELTNKWKEASLRSDEQEKAHQDLRDKFSMLEDAFTATTSDLALARVVYAQPSWDRASMIKRARIHGIILVKKGTTSDPFKLERSHSHTHV